MNRKFCSACGASLVEGATFCAGCGTRVDGGASPAAAAGAPDPAPYQPAAGQHVPAMAPVADTQMPGGPAIGAPPFPGHRPALGQNPAVRAVLIVVGIALVGFGVWRIYESGMLGGKDSWIVGRWVDAPSATTEACRTPDVEFFADGRMRVPEENAEGTWRLEGDRLTIVAEGREQTATIRQDGSDTFHVEGDALHRC